jgi:hypothetical protein
VQLWCSRSNFLRLVAALHLARALQFALRLVDSALQRARDRLLLLSVHLPIFDGVNRSIQCFPHSQYRIGNQLGDVENVRRLSMRQRQQLRALISPERGLRIRVCLKDLSSVLELLIQPFAKLRIRAAREVVLLHELNVARYFRVCSIHEGLHPRNCVLAHMQFSS